MQIKQKATKPKHSVLYPYGFDAFLSPKNSTKKFHSPKLELEIFLDSKQMREFPRLILEQVIYLAQG